MEEEGNKVFADLHIHSRFSRATSKEINLENLEKYAKIKGLSLLGTGDFQHPSWWKELEVLEDRDGLAYSKTNFPFVWQTEISLMYTQNGKGRRVHHVILAPNKEVAEQITKFLASKGRLDYDGRPIFGFSSMELVEEMIKISKDIEIIPAHCMTPWFGIFGSKTGFDSLKECFGEKENYIHAVESGMSADPEMLRKFSFLNNKAIVSFSDLHSFWPWRIGREAVVFKGVETYNDVIRQIRENSFIATVETMPAYGRYHFDGHRLCKFSSSPAKTKELKGICPICNKQFTVGVEYRAEELADREAGYKPKNTKPFYELLPLHEIISLCYNVGMNTSKAWGVYNKLIEAFGNEFKVLLNLSEQELTRVVVEKLAKLIMLNRKNKLEVEPGYDGEYGKVKMPEFQKKLV